MVTTVTLCATTLTRVTSMDTDSYIRSYADFYLMGGVEQVDFCHLPSYLLIQTLQLLRTAAGMCAWFVCVFYSEPARPEPLLPRGIVFVCQPSGVEVSHVAWGHLAGDEWAEWKCAWTEKPDHGGPAWAKVAGIGCSLRLGEDARHSLCQETRRELLATMCRSHRLNLTVFLVLSGGWLWFKDLKNDIFGDLCYLTECPGGVFSPFSTNQTF